MKPTKECYEAMKAAEVPGVSPATFENCGYQTYRSIQTGLTTSIAMQRAFAHMRGSLALLDHKVAICGYYGHATPHIIRGGIIDFCLILYLRKL